MDPDSSAEAIEVARNSGRHDELHRLSDELVDWMLGHGVRTRLWRSFPYVSMAKTELRRLLTEWIHLGGLQSFVKRRRLARQDGISLPRFAVFHLGGRRTNLHSFLRSRVVAGDFGGGAAALAKAHEAMRRQISRECARGALHEYELSRPGEVELWLRRPAPTTAGELPHRPYRSRRFFPERYARHTPDATVGQLERELESRLTEQARHITAFDSSPRLGPLTSARVIRLAFLPLGDHLFPLKGTTLLALAQASVPRPVSFDEERYADDGQPLADSVASDDETGG